MDPGSIYSDGFYRQGHYSPGGPQSLTTITHSGQEHTGFQPSYKVLENTVLTFWFEAKLLSG